MSAPSQKNKVKLRDTQAPPSLAEGTQVLPHTDTRAAGTPARPRLAEALRNKEMSAHSPKGQS